jgi:hypothetical protein
VAEITFSQISGELTDADPAAGALAPPCRADKPLPPLDLDPTDHIQINPSQQNPISVNLATFAKVPLCFLQINPPSCAVQKFLQKGPFTSI